MVDGNCLLTNLIYRATVITKLLKLKVNCMLGHQVYRLKVGTHGINVLLTAVNTD